MEKPISKKRTQADFVKDLNSILPNKRKRNTLSGGKQKDVIPEKTSFASNAASTAEGSGGGIAEPLTEQTSLNGEGADLARAYHTTDQVLTSSDGFFTLVFNNVKTINFKDAQGADVAIEFLDVAPG